MRARLGSENAAKRRATRGAWPSRSQSPLSEKSRGLAQDLHLLPKPFVVTVKLSQLSRLGAIG